MIQQAVASFPAFPCTTQLLRIHKTPSWKDGTELSVLYSKSYAQPGVKHLVDTAASRQLVLVGLTLGPAQLVETGGTRWECQSTCLYQISQCPESCHLHRCCIDRANLANRLPLSGHPVANLTNRNIKEIQPLFKTTD